MEDNKNAYSEVIEILKLVEDEKKLEALPMEMLELIKSKANPEYKPNVSLEIPLDEQNLKPETFAILNWITQKYWSDAQEDEEVNQVENIESNEAENTAEIINISEDNIQENVSDNIQENIEQVENTSFDTNNEQDVSNIDNNVNNLPVLFDNLKWYEKIKIKIIEFFNRIFKKGKSKDSQEGNVL